MKKIAVFFLLFAYIFAGCAKANLAQEPAGIYNEDKPFFGKTVVIDAGHGGDDPGAIGCTGTVEAELNLAIAQKLQGLLSSAGATVIMTRENADGLYDGDRHTKKQRDMMNRGEIIKNSGADAMVSIHMNTFTDGKYSGTQVFFDTLSSHGRRLAESVQLAVKSCLQPDNRREAKTGDYFILKAGVMPSVIVECGFISNAAEEAALCDEGYQGRMAWCIMLGLQSFFMTE